MCSGPCPTVDLAQPENRPSLSQCGKLPRPPSRILRCEVWAHANMSMEIMNHSIWWEAEASLRKIPAFSIAVTTKLKAFCVFPRQMAYVGALLTREQLLKWVLSDSESSAGNGPGGNYSLKDGLIYLPELHSHIKGACVEEAMRSAPHVK